MITVYPYEKLGKADHGWLKARHHFSFGSYMNPKRMHFGVLSVINDDWVAPHNGFDAHPHDNMEIITYVREGAVTHKDSLGNHGRTAAGDVQVMSAGSGITHEEQNEDDTPMKMYQIWIFPKEKNIKPRWESREFPKDFSGKLTLLVSGRKEDEGKGAMFINQDATILGGGLKAGEKIHQAIKHQAYILVSEGKISIDGTSINAGDGAEVTKQNAILIEVVEDARILLLDVPVV
jgi:redox-sensitive bicupin YhaK (pirin superfamily)